MIFNIRQKGRERLSKSEKKWLYGWASISALQRLWFEDAISLAKIQINTLRSLK